jgi:hypothetical protein
MFLPKLHPQDAPTTSKHSFLPYLFSCERKDRAAGGMTNQIKKKRGIPDEEISE